MQVINTSSRHTRQTAKSDSFQKEPNLSEKMHLGISTANVVLVSEHLSLIVIVIVLQQAGKVV